LSVKELRTGGLVNMRTRKTFKTTPNTDSSEIEAPIRLNSHFTYDGDKPPMNWETLKKYDEEDHPRKKTIPTFYGELNKNNKDSFLFVMKAFESAVEDLAIGEPRDLFITMRQFHKDMSQLINRVQVLYRYAQGRLGYDQIFLFGSRRVGT
jgi:hypothetical protein